MHSFYLLCIFKNIIFHVFCIFFKKVYMLYISDNHLGKQVSIPETVFEAITMCELTIKRGIEDVRAKLTANSPPSPPLVRL